MTENLKIREFRKCLADTINSNLTNDLKEIYKNSNLDFDIDYPYSLYGGIYGKEQQDITTFSLPKKTLNGSVIPDKLYNFYLQCFGSTEKV